jgi:hypothetical protein
LHFPDSSRTSPNEAANAGFIAGAASAARGRRGGDYAHSGNKNMMEEPHNRMRDPSYGNIDSLDTWLVDLAGNIAATEAGLGLLERITSLGVPLFVSSEQAMEWGSRLDAAQHATLVDIQSSFSNAARESGDLQRMLNLATQSQLIREAAEAFVPELGDASGKTDKEI